MDIQRHTHIYGCAQMYLIIGYMHEEGNDKQTNTYGCQGTRICIQLYMAWGSRACGIAWNTKKYQTHRNKMQRDGEMHYNTILYNISRTIKYRNTLTYFRKAHILLLGHISHPSNVQAASIIIKWTW
jgi:hypothetical protein